MTLGPDFRRGALDKAGVEAVGGVALMRYGENPLHVVERVKAKIKQLEAGLPQKTLADGRISKVSIVPFYDRTDIVNETIDTLKEALSEEALMASVVIFIFLLHLRSTLSVLVTLPLSVGLCFILMYRLRRRLRTSCRSPGLAIAIGDVARHGHHHDGEHLPSHRRPAIRRRATSSTSSTARREVGGAIVTAVSNTLVSFIPVFFLTDQEGKLFPPARVHEDLRHRRERHPRAHGRAAGLLLPFPSGEMVAAAPCGSSPARSASSRVFATHAVFMWALAGSHYSGWPMAIVVGVIVALAVVRMTRERFLPLEENPVSRGIARVYTPTLRWILAHKKTFLIAPVTILFLGLTIWLGIGTTLKPVEWLVNLVRPAERSRRSELAMHLRWQTRPRERRCAGERNADGFDRAHADRRRKDAARRSRHRSRQERASCPASAASSCRRSTKARSSTCRRCCRRPASARPSK